MISISIVSHGQFFLIENLLKDIKQYCADKIEVILTINIPEKLPANLVEAYLPFFPIYLIFNSTPKGFGANHNAAFQRAIYSYFCVLNPDVRLFNNIFPILIENLNSSHTIGLAAPAVIDEKGNLQDSARKFLNLRELVKRIFKIKNIQINFSHSPDWVAGICMLFKKNTYAELNGFNENYFMYCEDMDICKRLRQKKYKIYYNYTVKIIHTAQKQSHKNWRYFFWHIRSILRYFYENY